MNVIMNEKGRGKATLIQEVGLRVIKILELDLIRETNKLSVSAAT